MEPAQGEIIIVKYIVYAKVKVVEERFEVTYALDKTNEKGPILKGTGPSLGWFVHLDGSRESICLGKEQPIFKTGDLVKISFEKVDRTCPPSQTTTPPNSSSSFSSETPKAERPEA